MYELTQTFGDSENILLTVRRRFMKHRKTLVKVSRTPVLAAVEAARIRDGVECNQQGYRSVVLPVIPITGRRPDRVYPP
jgi:hypothetical protein